MVLLSLEPARRKRKNQTSGTEEVMPMAMPLPVTSLLVGVFALLMVPLSLQVSARRLRDRNDALHGR